MATRWVRSGAPMRRGAAPYADGCSHSIGAFTLHFPASSCSTRAELAADMARFCVRHNGAKSTLLYCLYCYHSFWKDLAPTCPSPPPPRRNPRHTLEDQPFLKFEFSRRLQSGARGGGRYAAKEDNQDQSLAQSLRCIRPQPCCPSATRIK